MRAGAAAGGANPIADRRPACQWSAVAERSGDTAFRLDAHGALSQSGVALRFPPQSKKRHGCASTRKNCGAPPVDRCVLVLLPEARIQSVTIVKLVSGER